MTLDEYLLEPPEIWGDVEIVKYGDPFYEQIAKLTGKIREYKANENLYGKEIVLFYSRGRWQ